MPNTFGGEWHRPTNPQRGHSRRQLEDTTSFDNQPATSYGGCLLIAFTILAALAAALGVTLG